LPSAQDFGQLSRFTHYALRFRSVIIDLQKFMSSERPYWTELESALNKFENHSGTLLSLDQLRRFHYLYERTAAGLAKINTFASEPETRRYLESLVGRAYGEIHETRDRQHRLSPLVWFFQTLPQTFRRHARAFWLSVGITLLGALFGGFAVAYDPEAKSAIMPEMFASHLGDPSERVAREERHPDKASSGHLSSFSAQLMVNNIGVSIKAMALGMTWGIGTIIILFYNGVILGVVSVDYVMAGQTTFLLGWLLPHGVVELPAVMMGGQAGLMLAGALIGWGRRDTMRVRLRQLTPDLTTLIAGIALMLIWAGFVESFFSQYHEPVLPYLVKIAFGCTELVLLILFLARCGRGQEQPTMGRGVEFQRETSRRSDT
jgi:uncharacterized membrane protein SpoIIM required for sporulation